MASPIADFEAQLEKLTARGTKDVPAVILSAIDSTGKEFYSKTSGYNGLSPDAPPVEKDATLWIASCTKLLASISALQLVERGLWDINDPVETLIPELKDPDIVSLTDVNDPSSLQTQKAQGKITLRQLLTHTSGLVYEFTNAAPQLAAWREKTGTPQIRGTVIDYYNVPLVFEPGKGWAYGPGIDWAGVLVERLNGGKTLGEYIKENIFGRLGEGVGKSSTFRLHSPEAKEAKIKERLLKNTLRQADGNFVEEPYGFEEDTKEDSGGAGLWSNVPDYTAVLADLIAPEPKLLKKETVEKYLYSPHIEDPAALRMLIKARTNMTPQDASLAASYDPSQMGVNHALGGMLSLKDTEVLPKGTLAWGGLPNLKWFANREKGIAAMFAAQVTPAGDQTTQELAARYFVEIWKLVNAKK
ncbi:beta-lactamase/transpeptidase-like protein [Rhizodiscina lignyota]|uniref:Beta-lactamase/transpeptidase-like protein n=1 Tax=Rhizodiscina lignyota TaxID=1504668 RepID=A0A9P4IAR0_9PEZI|nr:beta-lactamase/transpeptidase-like protein [Rhizodiscina lignyota]